MRCFRRGTVNLLVCNCQLWIMVVDHKPVLSLSRHFFLSCLHWRCSIKSSYIEGHPQKRTLKQTHVCSSATLITLREAHSKSRHRYFLVSLLLNAADFFFPWEQLPKYLSFVRNLNILSKKHLMLIFNISSVHSFHIKSCSSYKVLQNC